MAESNEMPQESAADRSRNRSIGRLDKSINDLTAALGVWGFPAGMTGSEISELCETLSELSLMLWARKAAEDEAARAADTQGDGAEVPFA